MYSARSPVCDVTPCQNDRAERFFVDITGPFHVTSLGSNRYAMLCGDDFTSFKFIRFLKHRNDAANELRELVAEHIVPAGIKIDTVRIDGGGEFEGESQSLLKKLGIKGEKTSPHTPQYNGVVERALGLLRDKTVALLRGVTTGKSDRLWAEAMNYACEMSSHSPTTSLNPGVSPSKLWVGHRPTFDHLIPFETVGYLRQPEPELKLAPLEAECIMLGIDTNNPRRTFHVRDLTTGQVIMRQTIILHPTADAEEAVSRDTATRRVGGGGGGSDTDIIRRDPKKPPTTCPHWGDGRPSRKRRKRSSMSRRERVGRKVRLSWREWSMRRGEFLGRKWQLRSS